MRGSTCQSFTILEVEPDGAVHARPQALDVHGRVVAWAEPAAEPHVFARRAPPAPRP